jgi:hypothetical protein
MRSILHAISGALTFAATLLVAMPIAFAQTSSQDKKIETPGCGPRVWIEYTDDDPDYFIIKNRSPEGWSLVMLAIDLASSAGNLVFDTDEGGKGVGGASPFYPDALTPVRLVGTVPATDGGRTIGLQFEEFLQDRDYTFHVDLDAIPSSGGRTWVLPDDVEGAKVLATFKGPSGQSDKIDAIFDDNAEADSGAGGCV